MGERQISGLLKGCDGLLAGYAGKVRKKLIQRAACF
jgi:hypothetical protein